MNIIGKLEDGHKVIIWGQASQPKTKQTNTGKTVTTLSIVVGKDGDEKQYITVQAWEKMAKQFASFIDKYDTIMVVGTARRDDYWSERNQRDTYSVTADMMFNQTFYGDQAGTDENIMDDDELMNLP